MPSASKSFGDELLPNLTKLINAFAGRSQDASAWVPRGPTTKLKRLDSALDPNRVRECDAWLAGWFPDDGSLYPGFDIGAGDVVLNAGIDDARIDTFISRTGARCTGDAGQRRGTSGDATRILCMNRFGTVPDPAGLCQDLAAAGRPGARYLVAAPSKSHAELHNALASDDMPPIRGYDREEMCGLLADAGLKVVHQASDGFYWSMYLVFCWHAALEAQDNSKLAEAWAGTWANALAGRDGQIILSALNEQCPYRHIIVATKPGGEQEPVVSEIPARSWPASWVVDQDHSIDSVDPWEVSLVSEAVEGWFVSAERQLASGFPVSTGDAVLDLGCGDGGVASFCARLGAQILLADTDADALERNRARVEAVPGTDVRTVMIDSNSLALEDDKVSRVICTEVLEHVDDPDAVLAEAVRVGKKDALYLLTVPGEKSEQIQKLIAAPAYFKPPNHVRILSENEFRSLVDKSGLEIVRYCLDGFYMSFLLTIIWQTESWLGERHHSICLWARTWKMVLEGAHARRTIGALNGLLPRRQVIIARKM